MGTKEIEEVTHEKIKAEIAKIFAELEKMRTENQKTIEETIKARSETRKIDNENRWYPFIVGSTVTLAIVAVAKLYL